MVQKKSVPPDGGWGWMIVVAYSVNYMSILPMMQLFGLIFGERIKAIGLSATDTSVIINTNQAFGMLLGLVNGALLKSFGYRKIAYLSAILIFVGVTVTAFADNFIHFLISYGLIYSLGTGFGISAYTLALNTYFLKKRGKALGYALTISGIGPIIMPQFVSFLLSTYGTTGAVLILGAITANTFCAASLLQPVGLHMKQVEDVENGETTALKSDQAEEEQNQHGTLHEKMEDTQQPRRRKLSRAASTLSIDHDVDSSSIYGFEALNRSTTSLHLDNKRTRQQSISKSYTSLASVVEEDKEEEINGKPTIDDGEKDEEQNQQDKKKKNPFMKALTFLINLFDLSLLADPIYVNIMLGMSIAVFSEINFSMLTPLILADFDLNTTQTATFMSTLAIADLIFRFLAPYVGDYFKKSPRIMYTISLIFLAATRFLFISVSGFTLLLVSAVALGVAKGFRTTYMNLVIPAYVPLELLASASGIQMMTNGLFFIAGGPVLGFIRDITGTYRNCVIVMNAMTLLTVVMWVTEMIILRAKRKNNAEVTAK